MEINFPEAEKRILKFWKENKIFEKSILQRKKAPNFVFYEGPPTANAKPGIHHVLSRVFKDIICRYKTMQGFSVLRKAGWDTHGLPVELEIEKKLGLKSKKDIEKYGIAKFNKLCRESVWNYKKDWEILTERIAFWLDMENPYITYETNYIETIWWMLKQVYQKGLLYKDYKVVPYCFRCGTALSSHEVALGYKEVKENSVYIKFKIVSRNLKWKNASILSWTTTPWTLPGNVALAVNPRFTYVKAKVGNEILILTKERLNILTKGYKVIGELKGKDLLGLEYKPLFNVPQLKTPTSYKVYPADFVTTEEGTGVVHTAVMYGEDDYLLGKKVGLPTFHTVTEEGKFIKSLGEGLANQYVKDKSTESRIIGLLKKKGLLFAEKLYEHDYPFCWRCDSPLLYYAKQSWFMNMQKVKKGLISNNQKINWVPSHLKQGRFGEWLKEVKDWAFSRERYWGTPLPIWQCKKCGNLEVIGSKKDLIGQKFTKSRYFILRHGYSLKNKKDIVSSWPEKIYSPLTEKGEKQIKEVARRLRKEKIDLIFSSDLLRTKQTAEILGKELGLKPKLDKRLRELDEGTLNGKPVKEAGKFWSRKGDTPLEYYLRKFEIPAPKGESFMDAKKRMYEFLKDIDQEHQNKKIVIVSHELPITMLEGAVSGLTPREIVQYRMKSQIKTGEYRRLDFKLLPYNLEGELDFHRPFVDEVKFFCKKCNNLSERVPEITDVWSDSGAMPFSQYHYPFENKDLIDQKKQFPADYISEAIDQTRGWFYTLHALSALLGKGPAYKNVISLGHVLDEKGEKMSKSKGNVVEPHSIIDKYGADTTRWYFYTLNQPGDAKLFSERDLSQTLKRFILTLWNSFLFFETYGKKSKIQNPKSKNVLDKWIISRLNILIQQVTENLNKYDVTNAARAIENFAIEDLSQWYIRRSRKRFQKPERKIDLKEASESLAFVLLILSKLAAPFIPFLSEEIYKKMSKVRLSIHLENWPKADKKLINAKLKEKMKKVRESVTSALAERARAGIKVRQPLNELQITSYELKNEPELLGLIEEEVNVKKITFGKTIKLDTKLTPELKEQGLIREVIRNVQEMRKRAGLKPDDKISVRYSGVPDLNRIIDKNKSFILKEAKVKDLMQGERPKQAFDVEREMNIEQGRLWLGIKKI